MDVNNRERRRDKRLPIELTLEIDEIFKQDNVIVSNKGLQFRFLTFLRVV